MHPPFYMYIRHIAHFLGHTTDIAHWGSDMTNIEHLRSHMTNIEHLWRRKVAAFNLFLWLLSISDTPNRLILHPVVNPPM